MAKGLWMYKLLIDTTDRFNRSIILEEDGTTLKAFNGELDLVETLEEISKIVPLEQIDQFYANPGPGSFTGIKVGIAYANILNWALRSTPITDLQGAEYGKEPNISKPKI